MSKQNFCPSCGGTLIAQDVFCPFCGEKVYTEPAPVAPQNPPINAGEIPATPFGAEQSHNGAGVYPAPVPASLTNNHISAQAIAHSTANSGEATPMAQNYAVLQPSIPPQHANVKARPSVYAFNNLPKNRLARPIVLICVAVLIVASLATYLLLFNQSDAQSYASLLTSITTARTPSDVAKLEKELNALSFSNPKLVDEDLAHLMKMCVAFNGKKETATNYKGMILELSNLSKKTKNTQIAFCSRQLGTFLSKKYNTKYASSEDKMTEWAELFDLDSSALFG